MTDLTALLEGLAAVERELAAVLTCPELDGDQLRSLLARRGVLVRTISSHIAVPGAVTQQQLEELEQSARSGEAFLRQLLLAKHTLSEELSRVRQGQRLWQALTASGLEAAATPSVDVKG